MVKIKLTPFNREDLDVKHSGEVKSFIVWFNDAVGDKRQKLENGETIILEGDPTLKDVPWFPKNEGSRYLIQQKFERLGYSIYWRYIPSYDTSDDKTLFKKVIVEHIKRSYEK